MTSQESRNASAERSRRWRLAHPKRARDAQRRCRLKNPEKARARWRAWFDANADAARARHRERQRRTRVARPDVARAMSKRWRDANKDRLRAVNRASRIRNAEGQRALVKKWRESHPDRKRELNRQWHARNIHSVRLQKRANELARRARRASVFVEHVDPAVVFDKANGICGLCRWTVTRDEAWHVDHIVPISKGGAHSYSNVQLSHARCNLSKGSKLVAA